MLKINDKKLRIIQQKIYVGKFILNGIKGYNINIQISFINVDSNVNGYINLDAGFEKTNDIKSFLNREYKGIPFDSDDNQFVFFEVFDTEKFLDTEIESEIIIKLKDIKNSKIEVSFEVDDELIKINFEGYLDIDTTKTKDTFLNL